MDFDKRSRELRARLASSTPNADLIIENDRLKRQRDLLLEAAKKASAFYLSEIEAIGECDHAVNICVCGVVSELDELAAVIAECGK